jgi:hypothetical protein
MINPSGLSHTISWKIPVMVLIYQEETLGYFVRVQRSSANKNVWDIISLGTRKKWAESQSKPSKRYLDGKYYLEKFAAKMNDERTARRKYRAHLPAASKFYECLYLLTAMEHCCCNVRAKKLYNIIHAHARTFGSKINAYIFIVYFKGWRYDLSKVFGRGILNYIHPRNIRTALNQ